MAKNLISYGVGLSFDTTGLEASQRQVDRISKGIDRSLGRAEKATSDLKVGQELLNKAIKAGEINQEQYNRELTRLAYNAGKAERAYERQRKALKRNNDELSRGQRIAGRIAGAGKGLAIAAGGYLTGRAIGGARDRFSQQQQLRAQGSLLDIAPDRLARTSFALSQMTGQSMDQVIQNLLDFRGRLGEAADDTSSALGKAAAAIGINAQKLKGQKLEVQLEAVVTQLGKLSSAEERLFRSREIFGDEAATLLQSAINDQQELMRLQNKASELGLTVKEQEYQQLKKANERYLTAVTEFTNKLQVAAAPLLEMAGFALEQGSFLINEGTIGDPEEMDRLIRGNPIVRRSYERQQPANELKAIGNDLAIYTRNAAEMLGLGNGRGYDANVRGNQFWLEGAGSMGLGPLSAYMSYGNQGKRSEELKKQIAEAVANTITGMTDGDVQVPKAPKPKKPVKTATKWQTMYSQGNAPDNRELQRLYMIPFMVQEAKRKKALAEAERKRGMIPIAADRARNKVNKFFDDQAERSAIGQSLSAPTNVGAGGEYEYLGKMRKAQRQYEEQKRRDKERNKMLENINANEKEQVNRLDVMIGQLNEQLKNSGSV